jgi:hypothetical protein
MPVTSLRKGVSALLFALLVATGGAAPGQADDTTAAISGRWKARYLESHGHGGQASIQLSQEADKVTGSRNGFKIENGRCIADTLSFSVTMGGRPYVVHGIISDGGNRLTLDYTFIDQMAGRLQKVTGIATLRKE